MPCRGLERVRCQLVEVDLEFYGWIKKANQGTEVNELDTMAETLGMMVIKTYGKEIEELYQMAVMDEVKVKLYYRVNTEGLYGKNWM